MAKDQALIYHITYSEEWKRAQSQGFYRAPSLDTEGFIHCSMKNQVAATAQRFFKGQKDLVVLCVDTKSLTSEVKLSRLHIPRHRLISGRCFRTCTESLISTLLWRLPGWMILDDKG